MRAILGVRAILDVRLPAPHRLWLVPGLALAVVANAQAAGLDLGLATVLIFGIVPHLPVLLGVRRPLPPGPMALFNAMHEPFVPLAFLAVAIIVAAPSLAFVAALAWLSHIVVDWALGDGLRVPGASTRRRSFLEGRLGRSVRSAVTPSR